MLKLPTIDTRRVGAKPRTLVLCFDGTTNYYDDTNTNVVKLFSLLKRDSREDQMVYYQPGVGTYVPPGLLLPITLKLAKIADQGIALYLDRHVMGGYEFLMKHYNDGDKICLFGYSRGAYTARALAGMLHKVGLLPPDNAEQIPFAYQIYKRSNKVKRQESDGFKKTFSREVEIEFMGVWDTVASVGLLIPRHLPFTKFNPIVKTFRHAVSLDERRTKFKQHLWHVNPLSSQYPKPPGENEQLRAPEPKFLSPTVQTLSPIAALRPPSKLRESNLKEAMDIAVTAPTPPTVSESSPNTAVDRSPIWTGGQGEAISPIGAHGQNPEMLSSKSWHPKEQTHVESSNAGTKTETSQYPIVSDTDRTSTNLQATKSDASLASAVPSERDSIRPEINKTDDRLLSRLINRLGVGRAHRNRTDSSGDVDFEVNLSMQDRGKKRWDTDVLEVWFAGCHGDVGGGAVEDDKPDQLSNITLRWMIQQIVSSPCGIKFVPGALKDMHISPTPGRSGLGTPGARPNSPSGAKPDDAAQVQERKDAIAKLHDNLRKPAWWLLEFIPRFNMSKDARGDKHIQVSSPNLFRGRRPHVTNGKIKVHKSVRYRMDQTTPKYKYRACITEEEIEWVD